MATLKENKIQSVLKIAAIAAEPDSAKRAVLINEAINGASVEALNKQRKEKAKSTQKRGRASSQVSFGTTKKQVVAKTIILSVIEQNNLKYLKDKAVKIDWTSYKDITDMFNQVVKALEGANK